MPDKGFTISTSPFQKDTASTPWIMRQVIYTLIPILILSYYYFGLSALLVAISTILGSVLAEGMNSRKSLYDGSAVLTGLILALTLPPSVPLWIAFLGGFIAIFMGKVIWGGLGQNPFNPALVSRAFLQAAFPTALTTWSPPTGSPAALQGSTLSVPFLQSNIDGISAATPLSRMKFEGVLTDTVDLLSGNISGSLGETSALLLILAGIYLLVRKIINWRIPVSILATVAVLSAIFYFINPDQYPPPSFMIFSGGLLFGTIYMATDPVTSPLSPAGLWIFGIGIGFFVVLIRLWGGLPEGVMYAILLMNATTPLINRFVKIRTYGYT